MTAEEAIAVIVKEMKHHVGLEAHQAKVGNSDFQILFARGKSYRNISEIIEKVTGEPIGVMKIS